MPRPPPVSSPLPPLFPPLSLFSRLQEYTPVTLQPYTKWARDRLYPSSELGNPHAISNGDSESEEEKAEMEKMEVPYTKEEENAARQERRRSEVSVPRPVTERMSTRMRESDFDRHSEFSMALKEKDNLPTKLVSSGVTSTHPRSSEGAKARSGTTNLQAKSARAIRARPSAIKHLNTSALLSKNTSWDNVSTGTLDNYLPAAYSNARKVPRRTCTRVGAVKMEKEGDENCSSSTARKQLSELREKDKQQRLPQISDDGCELYFPAIHSQAQRRRSPPSTFAVTSTSNPTLALNEKPILPHPQTRRIAQSSANIPISHSSNQNPNIHF